MMKVLSISMLKIMVDFAALLIEAAGLLERNSPDVFNTAMDRVNKKTADTVNVR